MKGTPECRPGLGPSLPGGDLQWRRCGRVRRTRLPLRQARADRQDTLPADDHGDLLPLTAAPGAQSWKSFTPARVRKKRPGQRRLPQMGVWAGWRSAIRLAYVVGTLRRGPGPAPAQPRGWPVRLAPLRAPPFKAAGAPLCHPRASAFTSRPSRIGRTRTSEPSRGATHLTVDRLPRRRRTSADTSAESTI